MQARPIIPGTTMLMHAAEGGGGVGDGLGLGQGHLLYANSWALLATDDIP
jgi:hypothetical protein